MRDASRLADQAMDVLRAVGYSEMFEVKGENE